jgi:hypothetical protein
MMMTQHDSTMKPTDVLQNDDSAVWRLDNNNNNKTKTDDDPWHGNYTVWQCGGDGSSTGSHTVNPLAFLKVLHWNIMECCVPKRNHPTTTTTKTRTVDEDTTEEIFHETIPYELADTTTPNTIDTDTNCTASPSTPTESTEGSAISTTTTTTTTSTAMTNTWIPTSTYTIEVWNAIVTVLCLNVFVQFFTGKKK